MSVSNHLKVLSVRLPDSEFRQFKSLAADRGISLQEAVHQALKVWSSAVPKNSLEPLDALEGSLAGVDVESLMRQEKNAELAKDQRWS